MHFFVHLSIVSWLYMALQCRSSMSSNYLVFHTSEASSSPAAFLFLIFLSTESSSSCVNYPSLTPNWLLIIFMIGSCVTFGGFPSKFLKYCFHSCIRSCWFVAFSLALVMLFLLLTSFTVCLSLTKSLITFYISVFFLLFITLYSFNYSFLSNSLSTFFSYFCLLQIFIFTQPLRSGRIWHKVNF